MVIDIQFEDGEKLLWELLAAIPQDQREQFAKRVNRAAVMLHHPPASDADVLLAVRSDGTVQIVSATAGIVLPLKGNNILDSQGRFV